VYDVAVKQLLGLPRFQNLLLLLYNHIRTICTIIQRLFGQYEVKTIDIYSWNLLGGSVGVGAGVYMYVVVVQKFMFAISPDEFLLC